jgi:hypothetical protein
MRRSPTPRARSSCRGCSCGRRAPRLSRCGGSARASRSSTPGAVTRPFGAVGNALVGPLARWDSVWYLAIANDGYPGRRPASRRVLPALSAARPCGEHGRGRADLAGTLVSLACFAVALVLLHR